MIADHEIDFGCVFASVVRVVDRHAVGGVAALNDVTAEKLDADADFKPVGALDAGASMARVARANAPGSGCVSYAPTFRYKSGRKPRRALLRRRRVTYMPQRRESRCSSPAIKSTGSPAASVVRARSRQASASLTASNSRSDARCGRSRSGRSPPQPMRAMAARSAAARGIVGAAADDVRSVDRRAPAVAEVDLLAKTTRSRPRVSSSSVRASGASGREASMTTIAIRAAASARRVRSIPAASRCRRGSGSRRCRSSEP